MPSPIDLRNPADARKWEKAAEARPGRVEMFQAFGSELRAIGGTRMEVLELGSGPGFLALFLLDALPDLRLTLLDWSPPMHELSRRRLGGRAARVFFLDRSFKDPEWTRDLGSFDAVVTMQAVHELRHKRYAEALHSQVDRILKADAVYLVCDHYFGEGGLKDDQLYMTIGEQERSLLNAGFRSVDQVIRAGSLVMHRAANR